MRENWQAGRGQTYAQPRREQKPKCSLATDAAEELGRNPAREKLAFRAPARGVQRFGAWPDQPATHWQCKRTEIVAKWLRLSTYRQYNRTRALQTLCIADPLRPVRQVGC